MINDGQQPLVVRGIRTELGEGTICGITTQPRANPLSCM